MLSASCCQTDSTVQEEMHPPPRDSRIWIDLDRSKCDMALQRPAKIEAEALGRLRMMHKAMLWCKYQRVWPLGGVSDAVRARCMRGAGTGVVP